MRGLRGELLHIFIAPHHERTGRRIREYPRENASPETLPAFPRPEGPDDVRDLLRTGFVGSLQLKIRLHDVQRHREHRAEAPRAHPRSQVQQFGPNPGLRGGLGLPGVALVEEGRGGRHCGRTGDAGADE